MSIKTRLLIFVLSTLAIALILVATLVTQRFEAQTLQLILSLGVTALVLVGFLAYTTANKICRSLDDLEKTVQDRTAESAQAIRHSHSNERRLQQLIDSTPTAIIMVNKEGRIVLVNKMAETLFGYSRHELFSQFIEILVPQHCRDKHPEHRSDYVKNPEIRAMGSGRDLYGLHKDGTQVPVEIGLNPVDTPEGPFVLASIVNITERKVAELKLQRIAADLKRSNEELEQFAYVASHDLQEPLRMVASYTQLLARRYKDKLDDEANEFIAYAADGANRMQRLINDLLSYSRVGTRGKTFASVDCNAVCRDVMINLKVAIEESNARINFAALPTITADDTQMRQLFQNLLGNAIKFRKDHQAPQIDISYSETDAAWEFCFKDNGIGMKQEFAERVFIIFERLHDRNKYDGTGIGLAVCKKIVERHGGRVWIESEVDKGTKFHFTISKRTA